MSTSAPPNSPPPPVAPRRRHGSVVGPLVLIFIGCIVLLENTGYLPVGTWFNLWRLWPLLLVLAGIELLFSQHIPRLALAALAAVVLVIGFAATSLNDFPGLSRTSSNATTSTLRTDLNGATQAAVTVRYGAGEFDMGPLVQPDSGELAMMTFDGPQGAAPQPRVSTGQGGTTAQLEYQLNGSAGPVFLPFVGGSDGTRFDLDLNPSVPITLLTVQVGASDANLDLSNLQIKGLDMSVGATAAEIRFPEAAGTTTAHISSGASSLTLNIPQGVAAQIRQRGGLSTINVDSRFPSVGGGMYRSPDYATAQNKIDLTLESGLTTIQVR